MPKISVIVPVYKAEKYLRCCIDSILSQRFSDFEVILVDDGSPDRCPEICEEYAARDSRVSVIHQENQGQAAARNHALKQAKGEWICFVDSDDLIHPQTVELLYEAAVNTGAGISMCEMLESPELPEDFTRPVESRYETLTMDEKTLVALYDRGEYPSWVACAKLIRREFVENYPFCQGRVYEDNEAVCHWVCEAGRVARIPHALYFYRTNPYSTTQSQFSVKKLDYLWALERIIRFYDGLGYAQLRERFLDIYAENAAGFYVRARNELKRPDLAKGIKQNLRSLTRKDQIPLTQKQFETVFDAMHPKLIRLYWPLAGATRTLKSNGLSGVAKKIAAQLRKGDAQ